MAFTRKSSAALLGRLVALGITLSATLVACAPEPVANWQPVAPQLPAGVSLVTPAVPAGDGSGFADVGDTAAGEAGLPAEPANDASSDPIAPAGAAPARDAAELGLVGGRLVNDALPFAARFVYVPGVPAVTERVNALLWSAIAATGQPYAPQVHAVGAGLADRGCVTGATQWPAAEVLADAATGPPGGVGTAVVCDVTSAFGTTLTLVMRVVAGGPEGVASDHRSTWYVDTASGAVSEGIERWSETAAAELWGSVIVLLRWGAGGLSTAPIAAPDEAQTALAHEALRAAVPLADGSLRVTLPAGLSAPELTGLGIAATAEPTEVIVDTATAASWASEVWQAFASQAGQPFSGITAPATAVTTDCALIPCVALTYDDGPSGHTPQLLDTFAAEGAQATFYMLGGAAAARPDVVQRAAAEGHELGSHTMTHPDLTQISVGAAAAEVLNAAALLRDLSGAAVATFRPPYGEVNAAVIAATGMPAILWTVDTNDWRQPGPEALIDRAVNGARPGGIVLFHDTHADTVAVAGDVVRGLRDRGFTLVTVSALFDGSVPVARVSGR